MSAVTRTPAYDYETAIHEAGHVWAYWRLGLPIVRYVTLRPRTKDAAGRVALSPRDLTCCEAFFGCLAGIVAEAILSFASDGSDWDRHLHAAWISQGAEGDLALLDEIDVHDHDGMFNALIDNTAREWHAIAVLAERLTSARTLTGRNAFRILDAA